VLSKLVTLGAVISPIVVITLQLAQAELSEVHALAVNVPNLCNSFALLHNVVSPVVGVLAVKLPITLTRDPANISVAEVAVPKFIFPVLSIGETLQNPLAVPIVEYGYSKTLKDLNPLSIFPTTCPAALL
jgi:hypothetical protein